MSFQNILIFFLSMFLCVYSVIFLRTTWEGNLHRMDNLYGEYVASACMDSVDQSILGEKALRFSGEDPVQKDSLWKSSQVREEAGDVFFTSLGLSLNQYQGGFRQELKSKTPVLCYLDIDGAYFTAPLSEEEEKVLWERSYHVPSMQQEIKVNFIWPSKLVLTFEDGSRLWGEPKEVLKKCEEMGIFDLPEFFGNQELFDAERVECIRCVLESYLKDYVRKNNIWADSYDTEYVFSLDHSLDFTKNGNLSTPGIAAFFQGPEKILLGKKMRVFGFAAYGIENGLHYFVSPNGNGENQVFCLEEQLRKKAISTMPEFLYTNKRDAVHGGDSKSW